MSGTVQHMARRWWAGRYGAPGRLLDLVATPLSWLWRAATAVRNRQAVGTGTRIDGLCVVSVGNLAVGGTGKTPIASWAAREVAAAGGTPALILSGYGVDEERLHGRWTPDVPVFSGRDRVAAARRAVLAGAEVAILDDGFQHRRLARDVDLVLLAVEDPLPTHVLPRGPYREPISALERADAIVLTRRGLSGEEDSVRFRDRLSTMHAAAAERIIASVHLAPGPLEALVDGVRRAEPLRSAHVVTGIARPDDFADDVEAVAKDITGVSIFADHHPFSRADAVRVRGRAGTSAIVMTEKDAVKLRSFSRELDDSWVLTQQLVWDWGEDEVRHLLVRGLVADRDSPRSAS